MTEQAISKIEIPKRLQNDAFRFIKLGEKEKDPIGKISWKNPKFQYKADSPEILKHLKEGDNYGVLCGRGDLLVIDFDCSCDTCNEIQAKMPPTFTVQTRRGRHFYYICVDYSSNSDKAYLKFQIHERINEDLKGDGEIRGDDCYVVGPGSIHPKDGNPYIIENDHEISYVNYKVIQDVLGKFIIIETGVTTDVKEFYDDKLAKLLAGKWETLGYVSRSEAEMALCTILAEKGFSYTEILNFMDNSVIGKWKEKPNSYKELTINKALNFVKEKTDTNANGGVHPEFRKANSIEYVPVEWTVEKIIPTGPVIFVGAPSSGKSMASLELCRAVCTGTEFCGYWPTKSGLAFYVDTEGEIASVTKERITLFQLNDASNFFVDDKFKLTPKYYQALANIIRREEEILQQPCRVIVIDSFSQAMKEDENDSAIAKQIFEDMITNLISQFPHLTLILVQQRKKGEAASWEAGRGSSVNPYLVRAQLNFEKVKRVKETDPKGTFVIEHGKIRCGEEMIPSKIALDTENGSFALRFDSISIAPKKESERLADDILKELQIHFNGLSREDLLPKFELYSQHSIDRALKKLKDMKIIYTSFSTDKKVKYHIQL